jgi:hypothetical protein
MNSPKNASNEPEPGVRRSSHLRILTVNLNTVRHPHEGPSGKRLVWSGPNGEQCEAQFEYESAELKPEVESGDRVEWINPTNQPCTIVFDETECRVSPFTDGSRQFSVAPGRSVFSGVISGKKGTRYPYLVNFAVVPDDDGGDRGDPVIIVTG